MRIRLLAAVLLMLCACNRNTNKDLAAAEPKPDPEALERAEQVAKKVEQKAKATEKAEGKQNLVKDKVRVKTNEEGDPVIDQTGEASNYGRGFHGKNTANGEKFDQNKLTAAHPSLPLGSKAKVTNLKNGKSVEVRINDRGPYVRGRDIDLSKQAAQELEITKNGVAPVEIEAKLPDDDSKRGENSKDSANPTSGNKTRQQQHS
jgi:rare lipoprotein A (peptidoglycan hydrolase)